MQIEINQSTVHASSSSRMGSNCPRRVGRRKVSVCFVRGALGYFPPPWAGCRAKKPPSRSEGMLSRARPLDIPLGKFISACGGNDASASVPQGQSPRLRCAPVWPIWPCASCHTRCVIHRACAARLWLYPRAFQPRHTHTAALHQLPKCHRVRNPRNLRLKVSSVIVP